MAMAMAEQESFDVERDMPSFLNSLLERTMDICQRPFDQEVSATHAVALDKTVSLLRTLRDCFSSEAIDRSELDLMSTALADVLNAWHHYIATGSITPTTVAEQTATTKTNASTPGRPAYDISPETLEELRALGFSWCKIAKLVGVSRWTIHRRVEKYNLQETREFSDLSDERLDELVMTYISTHGPATGQGYVAGYIKSLGLRVQRKKCIDGFSRRIIFLKCSPNNLAETVLELFLDAVKSDGDLWPSRIRVDKGVENVLVCDAMVNARGEGRGSFIAGPSTHNQRIERLWRDLDVFVTSFTTLSMRWNPVEYSK